MHLVFGHRIAREESLYDDLSLIIVKTFGNTAIVSGYSKYSDSGKFTTASGWAKTLPDEIVIGLPVVILFLWCLFQEKEFLGEILVKFKIGKVHVLGFFPLFADLCFDKVKYNGKHVKLCVLILDAWIIKAQRTSRGTAFKVVENSGYLCR